MKKILFVVTGVGLGDATREHAIIKSFMKKYPKLKILIACYNKSYDYFKDKYPVIKIRGYKFQEKKAKFNLLYFIINNLILPFYWLYSYLIINKKIKEFNPDIVISDFEPCGLSFAKIVNKKCIMIFGFDPVKYDEIKSYKKMTPVMKMQAFYFKKLFRLASHAIIPTIERKKKSIAYNYVNPIIRKKPKDLPSEKKLMQKLKLNKKPIIVTVGGSKFGLKLIKNIIRIAPITRENFIIFSPKKIKGNENIQVLELQKDIFEYLKVSKGIITLAGQKTIVEATLFKKPLLVFPIKNHVEQFLNAQTIKKYAKVCNEQDKKSVENAIITFIDNLDKLQKKIKKKKIETNGAEQVVKLIEFYSKD